MKKQRISILAVLTALFAAFTLGLFLGRNQSGSAVILSGPAAMQTLPPEPVTGDIPYPENSAEFPVNINTAEKEALTALPGIGEILAQRIIAYRNANGSFSSVDGLMYVEGIGEKKLEAILDLITIGG